jgi:hypothetical protein
MKTVISMALILALSAGPAIAGDMFRTFRMLPAGEQMRLTQLTDDQLAATEGENLPAVDLLLAALKENIAMLPPQTATTSYTGEHRPYICHPEQRYRDTAAAGEYC